MATLTVDEIIEATGGELISRNSNAFSGVSIDSRTIEQGDIFFALRGERFDGHRFIGDALSKGSGAIVETQPETVPENKVIIRVNDTLRSLQDLAHFLRMKKDIPVIAVTGSNGKTTTKEMICEIASGRFKVLKNEGNLNNHIGLPLSLTKLQPDDELIVLEMGMNALGEIRRLCEIAIPSHGLITNIGMAHVGKLGGYDAVRNAKLEVMDGLSVAVVNADDRGLMHGIAKINDFKGEIITFAVDNDADVTARDIMMTDIGSKFMLELKNERHCRINLSVLGTFNIYNALAAAAVCYSIGMNMDDIKRGLEGYSAFPMRFEVTRKRGMTFINDSYNANPSSMKESLKELARLNAGGRLVAVLGDMKELRDFSEDAHRDIGKFLYSIGVDVFVSVGEMMSLAAEEILKIRRGNKGPQIITFNNADEAKKNISAYLRHGDTILLKGSRSMAMEKILETIINNAI